MFFPKQNIKDIGTLSSITSIDEMTDKALYKSSVTLLAMQRFSKEIFLIGSRKPAHVKTNNNSEREAWPLETKSFYLNYLSVSNIFRLGLEIYHNANIMVNILSS